MGPNVWGYLAAVWRSKLPRGVSCRFTWVIGSGALRLWSAYG